MNTVAKTGHEPKRARMGRRGSVRTALPLRTSGCDFASHFQYSTFDLPTQWDYR